jgi:hypothetical protein
MSIAMRPVALELLPTLLLAALVTTHSEAKDNDFVGPYDFGATADLATSCDDPDNGPSVDLPAELEPFVPKGTKPIEWHKADLNQDGRPDYLLVVEKDCDERTLLVVIRKPNGSLVLAASNSSAVMERSGGGTQGGYSGTLVARGAFTISQGVGSGPDMQSSSITFVWSAKRRTWLAKTLETESCEMSDCKSATDSTAAGTPFESYRYY